MEGNCSNCQHTLTGKFCSNCGQSAATHRINVHFVWHDIQHGLLHIDKGILFTAKELFSRPGHSIREFLHGKRVRHFRPISLVLVLAGIYGLLFHFFKINILVNYVVVHGTGPEATHFNELIRNYSEWITEHYSIVALFQLPILALSTFWSFRKAGYNFIEHLIINTFLVGQSLMVHIFAFPFYLMTKGTSMILKVDNVVNLLAYAFIFWSLVQLFENQKRKILKVIFSLTITFFIFLLILITSVVLLFKFAN